MAELPYMPMYWDAYLSDTVHLSCLEHGAYLQILGAMWRAGGDLPEDDNFLMRVTRLNRRQWQRIKPRIMAFMRPGVGGRFTQDKLLETFKASKLRRGKASDSIRARWLKKQGLMDTSVLRTNYERNTIPNKIENPLAVQSSTPAEKESGSAGKKAEVAAREAIVLAPTGALLGTKIVKRAS